MARAGSELASRPALRQPGGVDYFLLGLCKVGLCTSAAEKRYSANLNTWLRTPGILLTSCFVYQG